MGWLNLGGKKRKQGKGFGNSQQGKSRKRRKTFILEKIVTPSAGVGGWLQDFDSLHQLLGSWSLSDLDLPNFFADSGVCPIDPSGVPTNNLPPLIDFDPLGLYHDGIATQTPYNPGGAFETLPVALIPVDPHSPNPSNPNAIRQLLNFPLASQPLVGSIDTGVSADSPYLNYANIKKGRDYVGGDDNPLLKPGEGSEHGTFMLGIIDAINKTAPKWVGRAIDSGRWADSLVEFVDAAKASGQKNAIANLSLDLTQKNADGSVTTRYELTPAERSAIEYARQNGVMLVVAAGNDGGVMSVLGQASQEFDNIFTVGAGDINGRSIYSSYGRGLDMVADGGTTEHPGLSTVGNDLDTMAGTSVATAKVAGAASLVWAANPALNYRQVMEILKSTARDLGPSGWDDETGFGFLNTLAAVDLAKKTVAEVYRPIAFLKPTTWGGEGLVTPMERAVNIINENFTAWVVSSNGITLRNSPNTSDRSNFVVKTGDTLSFDGWTYGEQLSDLTTGKPDALWYRFRYNGGTYWVPSAWTGGYPGSRPPLLPPTQQPPQQPPQQPTANTVYLSTSSGQILQVNTATGAQNPIYQGRAFTDLAVAPNGKLYGCTFYDGLYEINPSTGAERYVGPLAGGTLNSLTFSTDGRLYGADQGNGNLFQISPDNGQMNLIGNLGGPSSGDLVFNGANEIFATVGSPNTSLNDRLVAFNVATGTVRNIGDLGLREVYGLSLENGQLTAYTSDRRKLAIDPNTAKATVVGTVSSNGLIWGAATKPATASSPTDDVRQKFLYAASLYPQVGAAITGMQDQGGGVFRQEFERAIMIWNGQQVTVYETKGRSVSPTSPSPNPQPVNNINQSVIGALRTAIFGQESGYNYKAVNPNSGALGIAQVMPANIPSWSREALGYQITPNQFLNSPDLQLKIIDYKLNQYYQQAIAASGGNVDIAVRRVASAWYSGNPNKYNSTAPEYTNGVQYPSIANYTLSVLGKFNQAYGSGNTGNFSENGGGLGNSNDPISGKGVTIRTGASTNNNLSPEYLENQIFEMALKYIFDEMKKNPEIFNSKLSDRQPSNDKIEILQNPWILFEKAKDNILFLLQGISANYYNTYPGKLDLWKSLVDDKKDWDHKPELQRRYRNIYPNTDLFIKFPDNSEYEYYYDIWSNIHYGFVGKAIGISSNDLQLASQFNDATKWNFGDGPDYNAVALGMMLWDKYGNSLTIDNFKAELLANKSKLSRKKLPQSTSGSSSSYNT
ncbi:MULTISPECIES: S8 family serine peptidase [unclassified Microcoleus]|uniref:S8 family serine peptidase n=1 Tax=unclassified Microcoleus TaxID=2642155 RepID=UPI002FD4437E